jgi:hypothetical protein
VVVEVKDLLVRIRTSVFEQIGMLVFCAGF